MSDKELKSKLKYVGENVIIAKHIRIRHPEKVWIGDNCIIDDFTYLSGEIILKDGVHVGASCTFQSGKARISIDNYTGISSGCRLFAVSSDYLSSDIDLPTISGSLSISKDSTINDDIVVGKACLIGANSIILPGVVIPDGCSFGAASKISKRRYREFSFYMDECKKVIKTRNKESLLKQLKFLNGYE